MNSRREYVTQFEENNRSTSYTVDLNKPNCVEKMSQPTKYVAILMPAPKTKAKFAIFITMVDFVSFTEAKFADPFLILTRMVTPATVNPTQKIKEREVYRIDKIEKNKVV